MRDIQVKEKKVEQIELFYDLIYVYAISRLTLLVEEPVGGVIPFSSFRSYLVTCFVILQAWLYLTNYVNRYGRWRWYEYVLTAINMAGAVYMANTISPEWDEMSLTFNLAMLVMLLCVWGMYFIQVLLKEQDTGAAKNSLIILTVDCILYFTAFLASAEHMTAAVFRIDIAAVLVGAFLPFFIRGNFDIAIISFPHLAERFELLTIVTFGESVVGMTGYFDVRHFSMRPILVFAVILLLFGCYMLQLHVLCDHQRSARALRLMFTHYFIVISVNLITVALHFLNNAEASRTFTAGIPVKSEMSVMPISTHVQDVFAAATRARMSPAISVSVSRSFSSSPVSKTVFRMRWKVSSTVCLSARALFAALTNAALISSSVRCGVEHF